MSQAVPNKTYEQQEQQQQLAAASAFQDTAQAGRRGGGGGGADLGPAGSLLVHVPDFMGRFSNGQVLLHVPAVPPELLQLHT